MSPRGTVGAHRFRLTAARRRHLCRGFRHRAVCGRLHSARCPGRHQCAPEAVIGTGRRSLVLAQRRPSTGPPPDRLLSPGGAQGGDPEPALPGSVGVYGPPDLGPYGTGPRDGQAAMVSLHDRGSQNAGQPCGRLRHRGGQHGSRRQLESELDDLPGLRRSTGHRLGQAGGCDPRGSRRVRLRAALRTDRQPSGSGGYGARSESRSAGPHER